MDPKDFSSSSPGQFYVHRKDIGHYTNPLPPPIEWSNSLISALGEAERNLGRLASLADTCFTAHSGASVHPARGSALFPYRRARVLRWWTVSL